MGDFATGAYAAEFDADSGRVTLTRDGKVGSHGRQHAVRLTKNFYFLAEADRLEITYELRTTDGSTVSTHFAIENSFSFQAGHAHDRYLLIDSQRPSDSFLDSVGSHQQVSSVGMVDDWRGLAVVLQSQQTGEIWHHPIHTVSLSEAGFEKVYQGTTILNCFHISISPEPMQMKFTLHAGSKESVLREIASSALAGNF